MIEIFMTAIAASGISGLAVRSVYRREVETRLRIEISRMVAEEKNKIQYLEQEIDSLKRELEDSKNNLQHSWSEQQRLHNIIQENSSALQELQSQKSLLAAAEKENKALQSEVAQWRGNYNEACRDLKLQQNAALEVAALKKQIEVLQEQKQSWVQQNNVLTTQNEQFKQANARLQSEASELRQMNANLKQALEQNSPRNNELQQEINKLAQDNCNLQQEIATLKKKNITLNEQIAVANESRTAEKAKGEDITPVSDESIVLPPPMSMKDFAIEPQEAICFENNMRQVMTKLKAMRNIDSLVDALQKSDYVHKESFLKKLKQYVNDLDKKLIKKLDDMDLDEEEISPEVAQKYAKIFSGTIARLVRPMFLCQEEQRSFCKKFAGELNKWLSKQGIYTYLILPGEHLTEQNIEYMDVIYKPVKEEAKNRLIEYVEQLPYIINYVDDFDEKQKMVIEGRMIVNRWEN